MADDAADAWNVLEIMLAECFRRLDSARSMSRGRDQEEFSPRLLARLESLANRARINSPVRFHQSPFNSNIVVSLWCPWTIECMFADTQLNVWDERIRTTLEKWTTWRHFYNAGGEPDLRIRNHDLWPPSGNGWEERTAIRESECQSFLDSRDCKGLSSLFSASPRAFVFALGLWKKQFDSVFEEITENPTWSHALRNEMPEAALFEVREVLRLISEAHARVKRESDVANFDLSISTTLKDTFSTMLRYHSRMFNVRNVWDLDRAFFVSDCQAFENTLMRIWLTELAHSEHHIPAGQIPPLNDGRPSGSDAAARKAGKVPYWDDENSTLWLNGNHRRYASQLVEASREIFKSLENVTWTAAAPCSIAASKAQQCCRDRSNDNQLGIRFTYQASSKTVRATWKSTSPRISQKLIETPEKSPETPDKSPENS